MIRSYRQRGHLIAKLDPLELLKSDYLDELHPQSFGFKKEDYQKKIYLGGVTNRDYSSIKEILAFLKKTYCGPIGYEYMHIQNPTERKWFRDRIEKSNDNLNFTKNEYLIVFFEIRITIKKRKTVAFMLFFSLLFK